MQEIRSYTLLRTNKPKNKIMNNTIKKIQYSLMITVGVLFLSTPPVAAQGRIMKQVASNDCGVVGAQPFFIKGDNYMVGLVKAEMEANKIEK